MSAIFYPYETLKDGNNYLNTPDTLSTLQKFMTSLA